MNSTTPSGVRRFWLWMVVSLLIVGVALMAGATGYSPTKVAHALLGAASGALAGHDERVIVWVRLPRVLVALIVGASLGASGAVTQAVFRNRLADPHFLGIESGATLGVTLWALGSGTLTLGSQSFLPGSHPMAMPVFAFGGALLAVGFTLGLAQLASLRAENLVLAGVAVSSVLSSISVLLVLRDSERLRSVVAWSLGTLSFVTHRDLLYLVVYCVPAWVVIALLARALDVLELGDDTAKTLGLRVESIRFTAIVAASFATGVSVAFVGTLGWIGLMAPNVCRGLGYSTHRGLLPASAVVGALLLVLADTLSRVVVAPTELPVGVLVTWIGGLFLIALLVRR